MSGYDPDFSDERIPLAYLITFRCYGTWLHGDERGSTDRHHNRYGTPFIPSNVRWQQYNEATLKHPPVTLDAAQRASVEKAIRETCELRGWLLQAINVRTNHVHTVVAANRKPEPVLSAFKANATRQMRADEVWREAHSPWADKGSRRYLWKPHHVDRAIDYVVNGQGDALPSFDDDDEA